MDIAALLTPGSAPPVSAVPTLGVSEAAPSAELFSDLLTEALATPVETFASLTVPKDAGKQPKGPLPDERIAFIPPDSDSAKSENLELLTLESRPLVAKAKVEPNPALAKAPVPLKDPVPIEGPTDPPPCDAKTSRKDANAEAPNAPATKQDRPTRKSQKPIEAPVNSTVGAVPTLVAPIVSSPLTIAAPVPPSKTPSKVTATTTPAFVAPAAMPPITSAEPVETAMSEALDGADSSEFFDLDSPVPTGMPIPTLESVYPTDARPVSETLQKNANASDTGMANLESAPDLGIVPKVTVGAAVISQAIETTAAKRPESEPQIVSASENSFEPTKPLDTKNADADNPLTLTEAPKENSPASGGDASPNDEPAPHDNPVPTASSTVRTVATEKPEAGNQRPEVDRHLVVRQVADRIENLVAARPREGVTIHLEPRDLGSVTLVVKGLASALDVQMTASDSRVRESLDTARPELAQALAPRGIELRELRVAPATTDSSGTTGRDAGTNPDGRPRQQTPHSSTASFANPTGRSVTPQTRTRAARSGRGVDLLV